MTDKKPTPVNWKLLFDGSINEVQFFIPGIAPMGAVTYIYGGAKQGKSLFVLNAALNVSQGKTFLGQPCVKRRVAYLDFENSLEIHVKPRVEEMLAVTKSVVGYCASCGVDLYKRLPVRRKPPAQGTCRWVSGS